ncbi:MAG: tetratricopeptide repeat protein, partial [Gemmatimonadales bacterium]
QDTVGTLAQMVIAQQPQTYEPVDCMDDGHFRVGSGKTAIKSALEASNPAAVPSLLERSESVLIEAIQEDGQQENPAAWYWLGRAYLYQGDLEGADSALTRAASLAEPDCQEPVRLIRITTGNAMLRPALEMLEEGMGASAINSINLALSFYGDSPSPYAYRALGVYYFNEKKMPDSAAYYFAKAVEASGDDTLFAKVKAEMQFNSGAAYQASGKHQQAAVAFGNYLKTSPNDLDAMKGLAASLRASGMEDSAKVIEARLLEMPGGDAATAGELNTGDIFNLGVTAYQDSNFAAAEEAFVKVVAAEPYNLDARRNLAFTYLALNKNAELLEVAKKLSEYEPLNENSARLLGNAYKLNSKPDSQMAAVSKVLQMPVDVQLTFSRLPSGATLVGTATGLEPKDPTSGAAITPVPVTIEVQFLNATGEVVATREVTVSALATGSEEAINVEGEGAGIVGYRYIVR